MGLSPIIIFAFNRPDRLKNLVESLKRNPESAASDLFVFIDKERPDVTGEKEKVSEVTEYALSISGFNNITVIPSDEHRGLGPSIIKGVSDIISRYGRVIVLEDDLNLQPNFLHFMNKSLDKYENEEKIFSICGYTNKINIPSGYPYDTYFGTRSSSFGWGTWADRWNSVDWTLKDWMKYRAMGRDFNRWGGSDCFDLLNNWHDGRNSSWAIRFCFAQFLQRKLSVFPTKSLLANDGFDGNGTNCRKWSRFKYELCDPEKATFTYPETIEENPAISRSALRYHSIPQRILSRIMYTIYR